MKDLADTTGAKRILICEDEILLSNDMAWTLKNMGYSVAGQVRFGEACLGAAQELQPDLIIMDVRLEGEIDGIEAVELIRATMDIPVVYITGYSEKDLLERAKKTEPYGYLGKPVGLSELRSTIETALYKHEADKKVKESEAKYRALVEQVPIMSYSAALDEASSTLYISPQIEMLVGYTQEDYAADPYLWRKRLHPDDRSRVLAELGKCRETADRFSFEYRMLTKSGSVIWVLDQAQVVCDEKGRPLCLQGVMFDITDRRTAEEAIRQGREVLSMALDAANSGIWDWDLTTGAAVWSEHSYRVIGCEPNEIEANLENWKSRIHPGDWPNVSERLNSHLQGTAPVFESEYRLRNKTGEWQWIYARGRVVEHNDRGAPIRMVGVLVDISDRKKTEEALRESEERYRHLAESSFIGVFIHQDDAVVYANQQMSELLGYSNKELLGMQFWEIFPSDLQDEIIEKGHARYRGKSVRNLYESRVQRKNGEIRWVEINAVRTRYLGRPAVMGMMSDTTRRKMSERALNKSEALFRAIYENAPVMITSVSSEGEVLLWNSEIEKSLGWTKEEAEGNGILKLCYPNKEDYQRTARSLTLADGKFREFNPKAKDGSTRTQLWASFSLPDATPVWLGLDITDRKKAEEALKHSEAKYRQIFESPGIFVSLYDREGKCLVMNPTVARQFGADAVSIEGKTFDELHPGESHEYKARVQEVLTTGKPKEYEDLVRFPTGSRWLHSEVRPTQSDNVEAVQILSFDITERKLAEERLKSSLQEKEVLLREIHHRVKNNLAVIASLLKLHAGYCSDEAACAMFEAAQVRVRSMSLAHELLYQSEDLASVRIGEYIGDLVDHVFSSCRSLGKGMRIRKDLEDFYVGLSRAIPVGSLTTELISNALKHAFPDGGPGELSISLKSAGEADLELIVKDNGIGMPEPDSVSDRTLGLHLVKIFVRQLNGTFEITRKNGTEVRIVFPRED